MLEWNTPETEEELELLKQARGQWRSPPRRKAGRCEVRSCRRGCHRSRGVRCQMWFRAPTDTISDTGALRDGQLAVGAELGRGLHSLAVLVLSCLFLFFSFEAEEKYKKSRRKAQEKTKKRKAPLLCGWGGSVLAR